MGSHRVRHDWWLTLLLLHEVRLWEALGISSTKACLSSRLDALKELALSLQFHPMGKKKSSHVYTVVVQSLSHVWLFVTTWTAACQASLSFTMSQSLLKLMSTESMMPSNHLILYHSLFLLPSIFSSIKVFSNESAVYIRCSKYWHFSFSISPAMNIQGDFL